MKICTLGCDPASGGRATRRKAINTHVIISNTMLPFSPKERGKSARGGSAFGGGEGEINFAFLLEKIQSGSFKG